MKNFVFVSGNPSKLKMLELLLGHKVAHHDLDLPEVQSLDLKEVIDHKVKAAYEQLKKPVLVDDVALNIRAIGGLPGPFVKFFLQAIGGEGICKMLDQYEDRSATAELYFAFYDGNNLQLIDGIVEGSISPEPRGDEYKFIGMGWNPIFIPAGQPLTIAQMNESDLEHYTPRGKAVKKLRDFLQKG